MKLASDVATVTIAAAEGGRLTSLRISGDEVLISRSNNPLTWGSYPMVPFAGRVDSGRLSFDGVDYQLPKNNGGHALHGYGFDAAWDLVGSNELQLDFKQPWPFAGSARQTFGLTNTALTMALEVEAAVRQPVVIGWHPWFRRHVNGAEARLSFAADSMYELDERAIPTGTLISPPPPGPWDNCFTAITSEPVIRWGDLVVSLTSSTDHWVIYDQPKHALCVEPQTAAPNALGRGTNILEAGERLRAEFTLSWSTD